MSLDKLKDYIKDKRYEVLMDFVRDFVKRYRYKGCYRSTDPKVELKINDLYRLANETTLKYDRHRDIVSAEYDYPFVADLIKFANLLFKLDGEDVGIFNNFSQDQKFDFSILIENFFSHLKYYTADDWGVSEDFYLFGYKFGGLLISYYCDKMQELVDNEIKRAEDALELEKSSQKSD